MKIEKINDNQIRCTLTKEDLYARELKISELAYGSEKVKELFVEICKKAFIECNFDVEGTPLMIEAIPVSAEGLVLLVTKVENPEELDTRFSHFTSIPDESDPVISPEERVYADEIIGCMEHLNKLLTDPLASKIFNHGDHQIEIPMETMSKVFRFESLDEVIRLAKVISKIYKGENTLYKNSSTGIYFLLASMSTHTPEEFNKICNIISEYVTMDRADIDVEYLKEHCEVIVKDKAVQVLRKL
ncbi:MAG: adaptor protein MecA [Lachnospiraceae bacterium]|nr:adaptor protein MecA [Lachnospiraceae bacterium]